MKISKVMGQDRITLRWWNL